MARGKRQPFDTAHYETLKAQGLTQREIAEQMGLPRATLQDHVKALRPGQAQGPPRATPRKTRKTTAIGIPQGDQGIPPLYVHPGIPDESQESPVGGEEIAEVHHAIPALPALEIPEVSQGLPSAALSPALTEALTAAWPDLGEVLAWWRDRRQAAQESPEKLERVTYHVAPRWIAAVKREADLDGTSYAAVVNRAFAQYFAGKST